MSEKPASKKSSIFSKIAHQYWLCLLALVQFLVLVTAFFPGRYSPDTLQQLRQARGQEVLSDWQPVIMALIWRIGIYLTGTKGSLLILELGLLVGAFLLFSLGIIWRKLAAPKWAYLVVLLPVFPPIVCIAGSLWKDQLMTYLLLFAVAVLFVLPVNRRTWAGLVLVMLLFVLAALVRANSIFSVLLLLPLVCDRVKAIQEAQNKTREHAQQNEKSFARYRKLLRPVAVIVVFLGLTLGTGTVIKQVAQPVPTHQIDQLLLDDIIFSASAQEIRNLPVSEEFKRALLRNQRRCGDRFVDNTIWTCSFEKPVDPGVGVRIPPIILRHHDEFLQAWIHAVPQNLWNYLWYRTDAYTQLLFFPRDFAMRAATENRAQYSHYSEGAYSAVDNKRALSTVSRAVDNFSINYVPLALCPALWVGIGIWLLLFLKRHWQILPPETRTFSLYLNAAGLFYIFSLFPIVPANDYRYAYFTICATALATLLTAGSYSRVNK